MATYGLDKVYYAKITEDETGAETYGKPKQLAKGIKADLSIEIAEAVLFADDAAQKVIKEFKSGKLSLNVDEVSADAACDLFGVVIDDNGVLVYSGEDDGEPVAILCRAKMPDEKYYYLCLYKVKFGVPALSLVTKGDSISFQTPNLDGTVMRRNKPNSKGRHPWMVDAVEGNPKINPSVIADWYKEVYEPEFSGTPEY